MKSLFRITKQAFILLGITAILVGPLTAVLLPLFEERAQAVSTPPSGFNTVQRLATSGNTNRVPVGLPSTFQTCKAVFGERVVTDSLISQIRNPIFDSPDSGINTSYIQARLGQSVPVINWVAASRSEMPDGRIVNGGGYRSGGGNICSSISPMVPTATNTWRATQLYAGAHVTMTFTRSSTDGPNTGGSLQYHTLIDNCFFPDTGQTTGQWRNSCGRTSNFVVEGEPGGGGGSLVRLSLDARWADAATIVLNRPSGGGGGAGTTQETYRMVSWRAHTVNNDQEGWSLYFLAEASGARANQVWNSAQGCTNPIRNTSETHPSGDCQAQNGANFNCVPFIAVNQNININTSGGNPNIDGGGGSFASRVNGLGGAGAIRYDYREDCSYMGNSGPGTQTIGSSANARIWFYQSEDRQNVATVFPAGAAAGNEAPFTGTYIRVSSEGQTGAPDTVVFEGGSNSCNGRARVTQQDSGGGRLPTNWAFFPPSCQGAQDFGSVSVFTLGGAAGEERFQDVSGTSDGGAIPEGEDAPRIGCDYFDNALSWLICPFVRGAMGLINGFDSAINDQLNIGDKAIFDDDTDTGRAYHTAWSVFRTFALAAIAIAALIMVISQAAGLEVLDAYTIRKILPRLLIAAIGITLSWELMELAVIVSNDLGQGIRSIIYSPFSGFGELGNLTGSTNFIILLLTTGAILAYGIVALLSFVLTALLAVLIAFVLLTFREVAIIFLIIIAPLAIALSILPNTRKAWQFWQNTFTGLLLVYVLIMGFIAVGRVFSVVSASDEGTIAQLIAIIAYFAPYFLIPYTFRLAGGAVATIAGIANDRSKGMFDRLRNFRGKQMQERGKRWQQGTLFNPDSKATRFLGGGLVNRLGGTVGAVQQPGGLMNLAGQRGAAARANAQYITADEYAKMDPNFNAHIEDEGALAAHIFNGDREQLKQLRWFQNHEEVRDENGDLQYNDDGSVKTRLVGYKEEALDSAIAGSKTIRRTGQSVSASVDALAKTGKVVTNREEMGRMLDYASGGNGMLKAALKGRYQWASRQVGNSVVGRDSDFESLEEMSMAEFSRMKPWAARDLIPTISEIVRTGQGPHGALQPETRQHFTDMLFAAQYSPYTTSYHQEGIQTAIRGLQSSSEGQTAWRKAEQNYRSKLGVGGGDPAAQERAQQQMAEAAEAARRERERREGPPPGGGGQPPAPPTLWTPGQPR